MAPISLTGWGGRDTIDGGRGNDTLTGGTGTDHFVFDFSFFQFFFPNIDTITDFTPGSDKIVLDGPLLAAFGATGILDSGNFFSGTSDTNGGRDGNDIFYNTSNGKLYFDFDGPGGIPSVQLATLGLVEGVFPALSATDIISAELIITSSATGGHDVLNGLSGPDWLQGLAGNDILNGGAGDDMLEGGDGNDTLSGGAGNDIIAGDGDIDTVTYFDANGGVSVSLAATGSQTIGGGLGYDSLSGIENLIGGAFNDVLTGSDGNNELYGSDGADILEGLGGDDTIDGGDGVDTVSYASMTNVDLDNEGVEVNLIAGEAQGNGSSDFDILVSIENIIGSTLHDHLYGDSSANTITGNGGGDELRGEGGNDALIGGAGIDTLKGGSGVDTMTGGDGDDDYYVDESTDSVVEGSGGSSGSSDRVFSTAASYTLANEVEGAQILHTGTASLTGNTSNNHIQVGPGDNAVDGLGGTDTVSFVNGVTSTGVKVSLAITGAQVPGGSGTDTLTSIESLQGTIYSDTLTGDGSPNELDGWAGNDILDGGLGNDTLYGNGGIDTYVFSTALSSNVDAIYNFDAGETIELDLSIFPANASTGAGVMQSVNFHSGNAETAVPTTTSQFLLYDEADGKLWYDSNGSTAGGAVHFATFTGTKPSLATLTAANFVLTSTVGLTITGTEGVDALTGSHGDDTIAGGHGADALTGGGGNDILKGEGDNDVLNGDAGLDTLSGGYGNDTLVGGTGNDVYVFDTAPDEDYNRDTITGFVPGTDKIKVVNNVFQAFPDIGSVGGGSFISGVGLVAAVDSNDYFIYNSSNGELRYDADGVGTLASPELFAVLGAGVALTAADFIIGNVTGSVLVGDQVETDLNDYLNGTAGDDTLYGGDGNDTLSGNDGHDELWGEDGQDTLYGGGGADVMLGGEDSDHYNVDHIDDFIYEGNDDPSVGGYDSVSVQLASYTLPGRIENGTINFSGAANLTGNSLNNVLGAGGGNNSIDGGDGNDTVLYSGEGISGINADLYSGQVTGGSGNDTLQNIENITGTNFADTLLGDDEDNHLDGRGGSDSIVGGEGNDFISDLVSVPNIDTIDGGDGFDTVSYYGSSAALVLDLSLATAQLSGDTILSIEHVHGTQYNDSLTGNGSDNQLFGGDGNDTLIGGAGNDQLNGGLGVDSMVGGAGNDSYQVDDESDVVVEAADGGNDHVNSYLSAYELDDDIEGGSISHTGTASILGNTLNNFLGAGTGDNTINGGDGFDNVSYYKAVLECEGIVATLGADGSATVTGGSGTDILISIENISGSEFDDSLTGSSQNNLLDGREGNDTLIGGGGNDFLSDSEGDDLIDGGEGDDGLSYFMAGWGVEVDLRVTGQQLTGGGGNDTISGIERLYGSAFNDNLTGADSIGNVLGGGEGNDILDGRSGNDTLYGDMGEDQLTGGADADTFMFTKNGVGSMGVVTIDDLGIDTITDFGDGADKIILDNNLFSALNVVGTLASSRFLSGDGLTEAANTDQRLIFDTDTRWLYYDADGVGGAGSVHFLTLSTGTLTFSNIDVIGIAGDTVSGSNDANVLNGGAGNDTLNGLGGNDTLNGLGGNDSLDGGTGADQMNGGDGSDTYVVDNVGDTANETNADVSVGGNDRVLTSLASTYALLANVEEAQITTTSNGANVDGNALNNLIYAGAGNNSIDGAGGFDTVSYLHGIAASTGVNLNLGTGAVTGGSGNDTLTSIENAFGSGANDTLTGSTSSNSLMGNGGSDELFGMAGNDTLSDTSGLDNDVFNGGDDIDTLSFTNISSGLVVVLADGSGTGTSTGAGADSILFIENISGGLGDDSITGNADSNSLWGNGGLDTLIGGLGNDVLDGGLGNDTLEGGGGTDSYNFFSTLSAETNVDRINGFVSGLDRIVLSSGIFTALKISGPLLDGNLLDVGVGLPEAEDENDHLILRAVENGSYLYYDADGSGEIEPVKFAFLSGIYELDVDDIHVSSFFTTFKSGQSSGDSLSGGAGDDWLSGMGGNDYLFGSGGDDQLQGGSGNDTISGGGGNDMADYGSAGFNVGSGVNPNVVAELDRGPTAGHGVAASDGEGGTDTLIDMENLQGGPHNDILVGSDAANVIKGGGGDDVIYAHNGNDTLLAEHGDDWIRGGNGNDYIDGGDGDDIADYSQSSGPVDASLWWGVAEDDGLGGSDQLFNLENLIGSAHSDELQGDDWDNFLSGGKGNDKIRGEDGDDVLIGGAGNDQLYGGSGEDTYMGGRGADEFIFDNEPELAGSVIMDFSLLDDDMIRFDWEAFAELADWSASNFKSGTLASIVQDEDDFILYDPGTGKLYYDPDGDMEASPALVVTLIGKPALTFGDIFAFSSDV